MIDDRLRPVELPSSVQGALYLFRMPGRFEDLTLVTDQIRTLRISEIISLAPWEEIAAASSEYASAISSKVFPVPVMIVPVEDFGIPDDREAFAQAARNASLALREGRGLLVHCGMGIGRTGLFAALVLHYLDVDYKAALASVRRAGSDPERSIQIAFLRDLIDSEGKPGDSARS